jgi:hypothetical protein
MLLASQVDSELIYLPLQLNVRSSGSKVLSLAKARSAASTWAWTLSMVF